MRSHAARHRSVKASAQTRPGSSLTLDAASVSNAHDASPNGVSGAMRLLSEVASGKPPKFDHCLRMLGPFGMLQFARGATPHLHFGYCLDDNARAFLAAVITL